MQGSSLPEGRAQARQDECQRISAAARHLPAWCHLRRPLSRPEREAEEALLQDARGSEGEADDGRRGRAPRRVPRTLWCHVPRVRAGVDHHLRRTHPPWGQRRDARRLREGARAHVTGEPLEPACGAVAWFGRTKLAAVEPRHVKEYAASIAARTAKRSGKPVSATTVRLALAPVKALFATAVEEGLIRSNPTAGIRLAVPQSRDLDDDEQVKALSDAQLAALLAALPDEWRLLFTFLSETGLRIGEAVELRWSRSRPRSRLVERRAPLLPWQGREAEGREDAARARERVARPQSVDVAEGRTCCRRSARLRVRAGQAPRSVERDEPRPEACRSRCGCRRLGRLPHVQAHDGDAPLPWWMERGAGAEVPGPQRPGLHVADVRASTAGGSACAAVRGRGRRSGDTRKKKLVPGNGALLPDDFTGARLSGQPG